MELRSSSFRRFAYTRSQASGVSYMCVKVITLWASEPVRGVPLSPQHYVNRQLKPSRLTLLRNFLIARVFAEYTLSVVTRLIDSVSLTPLSTRNMKSLSTASVGNRFIVDERDWHRGIVEFQVTLASNETIITIIDIHSLLGGPITRYRRNKKIFAVSRVIVTRLLCEILIRIHTIVDLCLSRVPFKLSYIIVRPSSPGRGATIFPDFYCLPLGNVARVDTWR